MAVGIIGGTGLYEFAAAESATAPQFVLHDTPYGPAQLAHAEHAGIQLHFVPRHGPDHAIPPHRVNYRANIFALHRLGCTHVLATNAVGSLREQFAPGDLVIPHDYLDFTKNRPYTFFDSRGDEPIHIDQTAPYCPHLRELIIASNTDPNITVHPRGVYICTEGPRFETAAEIAAFAQWGADVVGMTSVPEVVLARELKIRYASICIVTNYAAGITGQPLTETEVVDIMTQRLDTVRALMVTALDRLAT